ncbi:sensor domain-containing diguanylate cyclase [Massilia soli]|uniref:Diguanylate cyclase n=1 Tax=Massilia soli TaxID=2792854 RepID=A0ABS7SSL7_9BURK|nr:diguanylate cyclase [Massilia soli]MBZ2208925.1 diguanylate cyclase [Massilia soli]
MFTNAHPATPVRGPAGAYFRPWVLLRTVLFMLACIAAVGTGVTMEHAKLRSIAKAESNRDLSNLARAFSEEVGATISTVDVSLIALRGHWQRDQASFASTVEQLNRQLRRKVFFQVKATDRQGVVRFASGRTETPAVDLSDRAHVRTHLQGDGQDRLFISAPVIGRTSGVWSVQLTRPLYDAAGKVDGVIVASVATAYFARFYNTIDLGPGSSISLVGSGVVLARSSGRNPNVQVGARLTGYPYDPNTERAGLFRRVSRIDGIDRYYAWHKLEDYGLIVTVGLATADAHARYGSRQRFAAIMGIGILLALSMLGWTAFAARYNRRRSVKALEEAEVRWKLALSASGAGVWDLNLKTGRLLLSSQAQALLGIDAGIVPWTVGALHGKVHPDDLPAVSAAMRAHLDGRSADFMAEYRVLRADGSTHWISERAALVNGGELGAPKRVVGTVTNIDQRKLAEQEMRYMASHDALTGLANRTLFRDRLEQALLHAKRDDNMLAVIYFDLDKFKPVNDNYGHGMGDQLLVQVARRVRCSLRKSDTLARLGGDEFGVLLATCASQADAMKVAENILSLLNMPFETDSIALRISGSVGVAVYPECGPDAAGLVHCADQAMYAAKQNGRNQVALAAASTELPG